MKFAAITALAVGASGVLATPVFKNPFGKRAPTDINILQYALTLEHLEATFYAEALAKFSKDDFCNAGFPDWVRGRVSQVAQHEASHVKILTAALGNQSTDACTYNFDGPLADPATFINFAAFLENIGVSAYAGANQYISEPLYSTVAATILSVEARHQGFFSGPVLQRQDWTGPYDTPLGLDMVYTLASLLITSCPASNPALPVTASPALLSAGSPVFDSYSGCTIPLTFTGDASQTLYAAIYNGLGATIVPYTNGQITLPAGLQGFSYILLTTVSDVTAVTTANTVAGPAVLQSQFGAADSNPGFMNPYGA